MTVAVTAPGTPPGQEVTRPFSIIATDGRTDTRADGTVVQLAASRRGLARILLTLIGGAAMILGTWLPFVADPDTEPDPSGMGLTADVIANAMNTPIPDSVQLGGAENIVSIGLLLTVLAGLAIFGLTGPTGPSSPGWLRCWARPSSSAPSSVP